MNRIVPRQAHCLSFAVMLLLTAGCVSLGAQTTKKTTTPAKPAATTPKPAASGGGSSGAHPGGTTTTTHGPTTGGTTHTGPTTGNPGGRPAATGPGLDRGPAGPMVPGRAAGGRPLPPGSHTVSGPHGDVTRRPDGHISDVHTRGGMDIHHGLNGSRRVDFRRPDGSRIHAERGRPGYVERRYNYHGHDFARRSYYWHGREYNRFYRGYMYHGVFMNVYAPGFYYGPGFYGWAYNPWAVPIAFAWGFGAAPWYGYYGYYWTPYPVYPSAAYWLTDYAISTDLQAEYAAQQEATLQAQGPPPSGGAPVLTPEIKNEIADEVKSDIALENAEATQNAQSQEIDPASSGIARTLSDGRPHVFVVASSLDVVSTNGAECALSDTDVLQFAGPPVPQGAQDVQLNVQASKGGRECPVGSSVTVAVADLQEMQNHLRETVDQGMQELQAKQGQGGIPAAPASATAPPVQTQFAQNAPPPEPNGANDVNQQLAQADQAEQEAAQAAPAAGAPPPVPGAAPPPPPAATVNIDLGQSIDQVTSQLGPPVTVVNLGTKKIYKYKDMKITFTNGKVSDVQ